MTKKKVRKTITAGVAWVIAIFLISQVVWMIIAGPITVLRIYRHGDTNIDDYSHYPGREFNASESSHAFSYANKEMEISQEFLTKYSSNLDLESFLAANDTIAFLVLNDDTVLYERYFQGHTASSLSQIFSVSKSFTSALIGLAIDDGLIKSVNQPIIEFIPELESAGFRDVTLHHLMTMMSGSSYRENDNPFGEHVILNYTPNLEKKILQFEMESEPGTVFRYKSGDNALLGLALSRALAPETITEYTQRRLWSPLGMEDGGIWTIDHENGGLEKTWCCLAISARDLAKFGRLYLNNGTWGEERNLPSNWVEQSTQTGHVMESAWIKDYQAIGWTNYGYQWWLASEEDGDYFGLGKDGQFLYVNPRTDTVIVRLGWSTGDLTSSEWISLFQSISMFTR